MPAPSPALSDAQAAHLATLGARIKRRRKQTGVSAAVAAQAAGVSRMTLHRIEGGAPSVTMGAYLKVVTALGLTLTVPALPDGDDDDGRPTPRIKVIDYPGLRRLAWQLDPRAEITEVEALNIYERGWRHLDQSTIDDRERLFIQHLADTYSHGSLLV